MHFRSNPTVNLDGITGSTPEGMWDVVFEETAQGILKEIAERYIRGFSKEIPKTFPSELFEKF